ncbi:MazG nucleotide pyrophosphohydrolase domain-containing protein [Halorubrum amylolyticum]|uniref:MazG nucleotide pyrophosphohydrolase domain-containing protein n=1 Tax=Halorubrum amylolyticum TaxID=2508724 RepID=UPI00100921EE|nr:MazG nucleotide pyrophosphohydrolase domain-containing protein [Halorubrum amylolyticum]
MDEQDRVAAFVDEHELDAHLAYRVLDLESEVGEIAKEVTTSTGYGAEPAEAAIASDEIGDALFALLALADAAEVDAADALDESLAKYEARIDESGDAGSGR